MERQDHLAWPRSLAEAKTLVLCHAFALDDVDDPRMVNGFLGSLRPFRGQLDARNFHELMRCLRVLAPTLAQSPMVDRELLAALWSICHLGRAWALEPDGMLQRNQLLSDQQRATLSLWLGQLSYAVFALLDGSGEDEAFFDYERDVSAARDGASDES